MTDLIDSVRAEYLRYKALAEAAIRQLADAELSAPGPNGGSSVATICWHVSGNLRSRFTDFLTSDGEKPWRAREEEFEPRQVGQEELLAKWEEGWEALLGALAGLSDDDLHREVAIRGQPLKVHEALHRSLAHTTYHVGQVVYLAKSIRGAEWSYLSIPPGGTADYNRSPERDRPEAAARALRGEAGAP